MKTLLQINIQITPSTSTQPIAAGAVVAAIIRELDMSRGSALIELQLYATKADFQAKKAHIEAPILTPENNLNNQYIRFFKMSLSASQLGQVSEAVIWNFVKNKVEEKVGAGNTTLINAE